MKVQISILVLPSKWHLRHDLPSGKCLGFLNKSHIIYICNNTTAVNVVKVLIVHKALLLASLFKKLTCSPTARQHNLSALLAGVWGTDSFMSLFMCKLQLRCGTSQQALLCVYPTNKIAQFWYFELKFVNSDIWAGETVLVMISLEHNLGKK